MPGILSYCGGARVVRRRTKNFATMYVLMCENPHPSRLDKMIEMIMCGQRAAPLPQVYTGEDCRGGIPTIMYQRVD